MRPLDLSTPFTFVLVLEWPPGQTTRLSTSPGEVLTSAGRSMRLDGGLPGIRWRQEVPIGGISVGQGGLSLAADLGDVAAELARQRPLEGAAVELSLVTFAQVWEQRAVLLRGVIDRAVLGVEGQRVELEIVEEVLLDGGALGTQVITATDWPDAEEGALDQGYPLVIGRPGVTRTADGETVYPGSPAWVVSVGGIMGPHVAVIAGHRVEAVQVTVVNATTGGSDTRAVTHQDVGSGRTRFTVATVDLYPLTDFGGSASTGDDWYVAWTEAGGVLDTTGQQAVEGAGDVLEWMLSQSTLRVDWARTGAARPLLNAYRIATYINAATTPWEWIRAALLPALPLSLATGQDGVYPVVWSQPTRERAVAHLEVGRNATRASRDEPGDGPPAQAAEVSVGIDDSDGTWRRVVSVSGEEPEGADDCATAIAVETALSGLPIVTATIELDAVADADTAQLVAIDAVARGARPVRLLQLDIDPSLSGLEVGDEVMVTDEGRDLDHHPAAVQAAEWASAFSRVSLVYQ